MESLEPDQPQREIRLSDADRNAVVTDLRAAMAEGRLTMTEFEERSSVVYQARFQSDLEHVRSDLPVPATPPAPKPSARPVPGRAVEPESGFKPDHEPASDRLPSQRTTKALKLMVTFMGGREWRGGWRPARRNIAITFMGGTEIDLTAVDADHVEILAFTMMGGTDVIVPEGAVVDCGGFMLMGGLSTKVDPPKGQPTMHVRVRGWGAMGGFDVHHPYPKRRRFRLTR